MAAEFAAAPWRVDEALAWAVERLAQTGEPLWSARMLLAHVLQCTVTDLFVHPGRMLTAEQAATYQGLVAQRAAHKPVAYLLGHRPFGNLDLLVDERVLIPRPETELLVEQAIVSAKRWPVPRIVDVGTGSGAIAVSLAVHLSEGLIWAVDVSTEALQVAQENANKYGVADRIVFLQGELLAPPLAPSPALPPAQVNLVVANLPYVSLEEYATLPPDIRLYEPREALVAGPDGLDAIRALLDSVLPHLASSWTILLEIGATQGKAVTQLADRALPGSQIEVIPDHACLDRIVRIER